MEMVFRSSGFRCLDTAVREIQNIEQTQEMRVTDDLPDIGKILASWGQVIIRGKEWRSDSVLLTGGIQATVLYAPEDGTQARCLDTWIPFQMKWDLPEGTGEGTFCVQPLLRFVDARSVSPRKIMIRTGIGALGEAWVPGEQEYTEPEGVPDTVELLRKRYPVRLPREAGEKSFLLEEDLSVSSSGVQPVRVLYCTMSPEISDQKVLANKIAFRGNGNLHVLYAGEDGALASEDFMVPFSQFTELNGSYGSDAQAEIQPCVTNLEMELTPEGQLHLKAALLGQYTVNDVTVLETVEDAYSPGRKLEVERRMLELPAVLEKRTQSMFGEQTVPGSGTQSVDVRFLPDFPRQYREENGITLETPGTVQVLYYGEDGALQSASTRWEGRMELPADPDVQLIARPGRPEEAQVSFGNDNLSIRTELPVQLTSLGGTGIPMVSALELGEEQEPDPARPSLILRRAGDMSLWELAKKCGSTVEAIRKANGLQEEAKPGQMLLIPVR